MGRLSGCARHGPCHPGRDVGDYRRQVGVGPRRQGLAHPQVEVILGQHALHKRSLKNMDDLLAVGVRCPQVTAASRVCSQFVIRPCHGYHLRAYTTPSLAGQKRRITTPRASPGARGISDDGYMEWTFTGEVIEWRGPAPYLFVAMTAEDSKDLKEEARSLIYWGQVPVRVTIGDTEFTTALFPKDGRYLVPVKVAVQRAEAIGEGAIVEVALRLKVARWE
jgi:Domain of unknown function (DUF1905)